MGTNNNNKKRKRQQQQVLKPGDEGYLTPTQLRNARKRRAAKKSKTSATSNNTPDPSLLYINNPYNAPIIHTAKRFFKSKNIEFPIYNNSSNEKGWRTVVKLAVRGKPLSIGLFAPKTHTIIPCSMYSIAHHPSINVALEIIQRIARKQPHVTSYNDKTGHGLLRHVTLSVQRHTNDIQLTLIWNSNIDNEDNDKILKDFVNELISLTKTDNDNKKLQWHSIWVHYNNSWKHSNSIYLHTGKWENMYNNNNNNDKNNNGIIEYLNNIIDCPVRKIPLYFPPQVFRQANITAFEHIVQSIRTYIMNMQHKQQAYNKDDISNLKCIELYGGVGTIGLHIVDLCTTFISSDENPYNVKCFHLSTKTIIKKLEKKKNKKHKSILIPDISYKSLSASQMVQSGILNDNNVNIVIVDPPRKGLEDDVCQALIKTKSIRTLIYVSCGFDAFQRDCNILINNGGNWKIDKVEGHILFPGSDAIETLAFFTRRF